jgi:excisionase family DNA binding protein
MNTNFITLDQAHKEYKISKSWFYKMCASRKLKHYKPANRIYFDRADLDEYIRQTEVITASNLQDRAFNILINPKNKNNGY